MKIQLDRADFFELQALSLRVENARLVASTAAATMQAAQAKAQAKLTELAGRHGFDSTDTKQSLLLDDATHSLVIDEH
jgi:glutamine cyclotransferase